MTSNRLFLAIDLPDSIKHYLYRLFPHDQEGARWTPAQNLHLTLRFIGDADEEAEERLIEELEQVRVAPFKLAVEEFGFFPPKGPPKVFWVGVGSGHPHLFQLRQQVDDAILRAGVECEMRDFVPHITLARLKNVSEASSQQWLKKVEGEQGPLFSVREFVLFESRPSPDGAQYRPLEVFPLLDR